MTGRYPIHLGMQDGVIGYRQPFGLPFTLEDGTPIQLLPEKMKEIGYKTVMYGKWHLGFYQTRYTPIERGFDEFMGIFGGGTNHYTYESGGREGRSLFDSKYVDLHEGIGNKQVPIPGKLMSPPKTCKRVTVCTVNRPRSDSTCHVRSTPMSKAPSLEPAKH